VIVRGRVGDTEIERDVVDEWRVRQRDAAGGEVRTGGEHQSVSAGGKRLAFEQRLVGAAVGIGAPVLQ